MTLTAPVAMSVVGDALAVRHLRAGGVSYAVWLINDDGKGERFVARARTCVISVIATLLTDGADFSERVIPISTERVTSFHVQELSLGVVAVLFSDGTTIKSFTWNPALNTVLTPVVTVGSGFSPGQIVASAALFQLYIRDRDLFVKVNGGLETRLADLTGSEVSDQDVVRKQ